METDKERLLSQIDTYTSQLTDLSEEVAQLKRESERLASEKVDLSKQLSLYTASGTTEMASEFQAEEWRVNYEAALQRENSGMSESGSGGGKGESPNGGLCCLNMSMSDSKKGD